MRIILLATVLCGSVSAMSDAEAKAEFTKITISCLKDHPVEMTELIKLKSLVLPDNRDVKCLLACAYRKVGTLREDGTFDINKAYELAEKAKEGDEVAITNGKKFADVCNKVNDNKVSDGNQGCERSGLMFKCVIENAPKFGFTV